MKAAQHSRDVVVNVQDAKLVSSLTERDLGKIDRANGAARGQEFGHLLCNIPRDVLLRFAG